MVYKWTHASQSWELYGEALGSTAKKVLDGESWDVVKMRCCPSFCVVLSRIYHQIETVMVETTPFKMGFNRDEDPVDIANRFVKKNKLPEYFVEDILKYVSPMVDQKALKERKKVFVQPLCSPILLVVFLTRSFVLNQQAKCSDC